MARLAAQSPKERPPRKRSRSWSRLCGGRGVSLAVPGIDRYLAVGQPHVAATDSSITVRYDGLQSPQQQRLDIVVELKARIEAGSDVCVLRSPGTIADTPHYREYLAKINALRNRHAEFLLKGLYRDTDFFTVDSPEVDAQSFESGDRLLVVLTQNGRPAVTAKLTVPGYRLLKTEGLGNTASTRTPRLSRSHSSSTPWPWASFRNSERSDAEKDDGETHVIKLPLEPGNHEHDNHEVPKATVMTM